MGKHALIRDFAPHGQAERAVVPRLITATSLFDGHDAAINIMRRIMQGMGAEVIHLGHNRSVREIVAAALQEDAHGVAVSCYQGGHREFYQYLVDELRQQHASSIKVFGGGGGVIQADEIRQLQDYGVTRIYAPEDGQRMGLQGMIADLITRCIDGNPKTTSPFPHNSASPENFYRLAQRLTQIQTGHLSLKARNRLAAKAKRAKGGSAILGVTGTGGAGKSSLTDELIQRFRVDYDDRLRIAVIAIDPSRQKTGGAFLGDRLRMNAIDSPTIFMRSMATRDASMDIPKSLGDGINALVAEGFDLVIIETPGIGQGDIGIVSLVDVSLYVMTSEFGAATQLEKVGMLDYADVVAINKFDRKGSQDALRDVQKQFQRNRELFSVSPSTMPVYGTIASKVNDTGVTALYRQVLELLRKKGLRRRHGAFSMVGNGSSEAKAKPIIPHRQHYLSDIAEAVRTYRAHVNKQSQSARQLQQFMATRDRLGAFATAELDDLIVETRKQIAERCADLLAGWPDVKKRYSAEEISDDYRGQVRQLRLTKKTLSGVDIPRIALPDYQDHGDLLQWLMLENVPGAFPFTAGVFPFKRADEEPTRMFAGEGDPYRTNKRFKYLAAQSGSNRLSTAFDSVTLYGHDPDLQPDILGKVGNSGVSVATLEDMKALYGGFDLCDPATSVSMTINGPAPVILAMFFNTAIDQQVDRFVENNSRSPTEEEVEHLKAHTLNVVRGTVQADILKEDQGQNTCIFSTDFSLKMMADVQEYFIQRQIQHFYSVSVAGYHIAEAGANPITQLAFTLANGFTYVEAFLARHMRIDEFAPRLSFFFSNGMDPEYTVIGRVARRIWAIALRECYGAAEHSQKLKYHIQTSGRSLHAQAMDYNEVRTTLQALIAIYDNCNSLHTNAKDEALTTPTEDSVRGALAIQMIINREWGLAKNENPNQGAFIIEQLTDRVEEAVLREFDRLSERGGVLEAMETGYQRSKIQEESMLYEAGKHDGSVPIVGVNLAHSNNDRDGTSIHLARSTDEEKIGQIECLKRFKQQHQDQADVALARLKNAATSNKNIFAELMNTVRVCTLGQITHALFDVGGKYRRNM